MTEKKKELNASEIDNLKKVLAELDQKIKNLEETEKKNNEKKKKKVKDKEDEQNAENLTGRIYSLEKKQWTKNIYINTNIIENVEITQI